MRLPEVERRGRRVLGEALGTTKSRMPLATAG
jgi:hypothetical protein